MSIKFNLSYKFNKLQQIHNNKLNKMGSNNFEELLKINSQIGSSNINHLDINSETNISSSTLNSQLLSINNQYIDDELLNTLNSLSNTNNNISSIIDNLYENNLESSSGNTSNNSNTNTNSSSNNTSNTITNKVDLSPSKVDYTSSNIDKTKAKPSYEEIENWVNKYAKKYDIEPSLVMAIIKAESSFNNQSISKSGAVGLTQLMPTTAREMGLVVNSTTDERWDPEKNIEAGIAYISKYHKVISNHFGKEDWNLTIAAYNCGPNRVIKDGKVPNITETKNYVNKVNKYWKEFI